MNRYALALCLFLAALAVHAKGIRDDANFAGDAARASYAFGMTVGGDLKQAGLKIDYFAFMEGLRAAMEGSQTVIDRDQALEIVQDVFESTMREQTKELAEKEVAFLRENAAQPGIQTTDSGLQYQVLQEGSGPRPTIDDIVKVHYEGALIDGSVFDSSYERDEPEDIPLDMVIPGWAEGIMLMNAGGKLRLYIPSSMAYGERGAGQVIPPFSTLVFTVELLEILKIEEDDEE